LPSVISGHSSLVNSPGLGEAAARVSHDSTSTPAERARDPPICTAIGRDSDQGCGYAYLATWRGLGCAHPVAVPA
jgi:hypothetical protein